ncbi:hypothetical protein GCM10018780_06130 [Streptomyces lanatus]|nr:hypothetical protein GCM10018780_06130 [Streptomyces lanatus]
MGRTGPGRAVNRFDGARDYEADDVRYTLDLDPQVTVVMCDVRSLALAAVR